MVTKEMDIKRLLKKRGQNLESFNFNKKFEKEQRTYELNWKLSADLCRENASKAERLLGRRIEASCFPKDDDWDYLDAFLKENPMSGSMADHVSMRFYRLNTKRNGILHMYREEPDDTCFTVCITREEDHRLAGQLSTYDMAKAGTSFCSMIRHIEELRDLQFIGAQDFSYNTFKDPMIQNGWQPQHYLLCRGVKKKVLKKVLRRRFKDCPELGIFRPVKIRKFDNTDIEVVSSVFGYCLKSRFNYRSGYIKSDGTRDTWDYPLDGQPHLYRELALYLDQWRVADRMLFKGFRPNGCEINLI